MPHKPADGRVRGIEQTRGFEPLALDVRAARTFVAGALAEAGYEGDVDTVLLLVSELATNAVRHARSGFELTVDARRTKVRVTVTDDAGHTEPRVRDPRPDDTDGRGLLIVERLARSWGCDPVGTDRKAVWFTLP